VINGSRKEIGRVMTEEKIDCLSRLLRSAP